MAAMMMVATAAPAFAVSSDTCTNNGCKENNKKGPTSPAESETANDPFLQTQETSQQNSPNAKKANKVTLGPTCNYTPGGKLIENGTQASDPGCPATAPA